MTLLAVIVVGCVQGEENPQSQEVAAPPLADYGRLMAGCLATAGWADIEVQNGGLVVSGVPPEQQDQFRADSVSCEIELGYDALPAQLDRQQLSAQYDLELETQECLRNLGYETVLPSRQEYIDRYYSNDSFESQYFQLGALEAADLASVEQACPEASTVFEPFAE